MLSLPQGLKKECSGRLSTISQSASYSALLRSLIVQGLIKIQEAKVDIQCRAEDTAKVTQVNNIQITHMPFSYPRAPYLCFRYYPKLSPSSARS